MHSSCTTTIYSDSGSTFACDNVEAKKHCDRKGGTCPQVLSTASERAHRRSCRRARRRASVPPARSTRRIPPRWGATSIPPAPRSACAAPCPLQTKCHDARLPHPRARGAGVATAELAPRRRQHRYRRLDCCGTPGTGDVRFRCRRVICVITLRRGHLQGWRRSYDRSGGARELCGRQAGNGTVAGAL